MNIRRSISVLAFTLAPLAVQAQSFDCRTARHADEYAICDNGDLAELDIQMSNMYFRVLNSLGGVLQLAKRQQRDESAAAHAGLVIER